jgi:hypothetical protein
MAQMFNPQNPEMMEISRQRRLADLLTSQGMQTPQGQTVSGGIYVPPNPMEYIAKLYSTYQGTQANKDLDAREAEYAKALRELGVTETQRILDTAQGTPEKVTELAGPAYQGVAPTATMPAVAGNRQAALSMALKAQSPQGQRLVDPLMKMALPELTPEERRYNAAVADGSFKGGFNAFMNQMSDKDKASLILDKQRLALENQRLAMAQQELAFNTGIGMPTSGQAPMQTINPGSPILAPGQQMSQPMGMPNLSPKALQDINITAQKERNKLQIEAQNALPAALQTVEMGLQTINGLIGDTTVDKKGNVVEGKIPPHPGFKGAVGISGLGTGFGAAGYIPGTDVSDFKNRLKQTEGQAFLQAIGSLRGTGAISEVEGSKATAAINRMSLSQSEKEFVQAANEFRDIMSKGYKAAQQRAGAVAINPLAPPSVGNATKLRWNQQTGAFE